MANSIANLKKAIEFSGAGNGNELLAMFKDKSILALALRTRFVVDETSEDAQLGKCVRSHPSPESAGFVYTCGHTSSVNG